MLVQKVILRLHFKCELDYSLYREVYHCIFSHRKKETLFLKILGFVSGYQYLDGFLWRMHIFETCDEYPFNIVPTQNIYYLIGYNGLVIFDKIRYREPIARASVLCNGNFNQCASSVSEMLKVI